MLPTKAAAKSYKSTLSQPYTAEALTQLEPYSAESTKAKTLKLLQK